jgi:hypothetical protein
LSETSKDKRIYPFFTRSEILIFLAIFTPIFLAGPDNFSGIYSIPTEQKWYIGTEKKGITLQEIQDPPSTALFTDGVNVFTVSEREWNTIKDITFKIVIFEYETPPYVWVIWKNDSWVSHSLLTFGVSLGGVLVLRAIRLKGKPA